MMTRLPLALLTVALLCAPALAGEMYRWTDDKGVVHYTDTPPAGTEFEQRDLPKEADSKPFTPPPPPAAPSARCEQARRNVEVFETNEKVSMDTDGDGVEESLDSAAHARELAKAREQVTRLCAAPAPPPPAGDAAESDDNDAG